MNKRIQFNLMSSLKLMVSHHQKQHRKRSNNTISTKTSSAWHAHIAHIAETKTFVPLSTSHLAFAARLFVLVRNHNNLNLNFFVCSFGNVHKNISPVRWMHAPLSMSLQCWLHLRSNLYGCVCVRAFQSTVVLEFSSCFERPCVFSPHDSISVFRPVLTPPSHFPGKLGRLKSMETNTTFSCLQ